MTSEEVPPPDPVRARDPEERSEPGEPREPGEPGESGDQGEATPREQGGDPGQDRARLNLTDPKAIRALAHPVRWALLDALDQAGTLTATQASEMLGESPANCAFHLRTLAKYGYVEEAGGGRGRERPWRPSFDSLSWRSLQDDPEATRAVQALSQVWFDRTLARARRSLSSKATWPEALRDSLGASTTRFYLTPDEAVRLYDEVWEAYERLLGMDSPYADRKTPKLRPPDAVPVEFILLSYPLLDLPALPEGAEDDDEADSETDPDG